MNLQIELLSRAHRRDNFDCGEESLNEFLQQYARQNDSKDISRTYVLLEGDSADILGYYTLCSGSIAFEVLPETLARKVPRYPIPTAHIGRFAVDRTQQGRGLGALLLADALKRICRIAEQVGIHVITVQALHAKARSFYKTFGFMPLMDDPLHLFLPLATVRIL